MLLARSEMWLPKRLRGGFLGDLIEDLGQMERNGVSARGQWLKVGIDLGSYLVAF